MRLINVKIIRLEVFMGSPPPYAILSHTWTNEEVTFDDLQRHVQSDPSLFESRVLIPGWPKIRETCKLAHEEGLSYAWIDTCCINKESSAELSESINSMFRWYQAADVCYTYLEDVKGWATLTRQGGSLEVGPCRNSSHREVSDSSVRSGSRSAQEQNWLNASQYLQRLTGSPS